MRGRLFYSIIITAKGRKGRRFFLPSNLDFPSPLGTEKLVEALGEIMEVTGFSHEQVGNRDPGGDLYMHLGALHETEHNKRFSEVELEDFDYVISTLLEHSWVEDQTYES